MATDPRFTPPQEGDEIDGFRLGARLHLGGMAAIHRLVGPGGPLPLVMKLPRLGLGEPASTVVSFEVERMVLGALSGPHVPALVCTGEIEARPYLVMEHVEGRSLGEWQRRAPLPADEVARLGAAVATALHELHRQHAVHLDLRPDNVLIRPDGRAVLIDFGLARHARYPDLHAEETRAPVGNWHTMSPEQVRGVRGDPRSDVFALGVLLYTLATGRLPFGAPTTLRALRRRLAHEPVPPRAIVPALPAWLQEVVLRCLAPRADERYASAAQVAFDLVHHDQVVIGERGRRVKAPGWREWVRQRLRGAAVGAAPAPAAVAASAPIVLVAIATTHTDEAMFQALRDAAAQVVAAQPRCRLACVTVTPPEPTFGAERLDEAATSVRIRHLVRLRRWARPLALPDERVSFHVIAADAPAQALLEYARANNVEQILIGAPPVHGTAPWRAAVATHVMGGAPCNVTIVRPRAGDTSPVE